MFHKKRSPTRETEIFILKHDVRHIVEPLSSSSLPTWPPFPGDDENSKGTDNKALSLAVFSPLPSSRTHHWRRLLSVPFKSKPLALSSTTPLVHTDGQFSVLPSAAPHEVSTFPTRRGMEYLYSVLHTVHSSMTPGAAAALLKCRRFQIFGLVRKGTPYLVR